MYFKWIGLKVVLHLAENWIKINIKNIELYIRTVVIKRKRNKNNTLIQNQQQKINIVNVSNYKRTFIIGFSKGGESHLMKYILLQKEKPTFEISKSLNQSPNINAQTSNEIQQLEKYENSTVVSDDMFLSKQESNIYLLFTRGRHRNIDTYFMSQSFFHLPKNTNGINCNIIILF